MQEQTSATVAQTESVPQIPAQPRRFGSALFHHEPHQHKPRNPNQLHKEERAEEGLNTRIAILLTKSVGSMWTAYIFVVIAVIGLLAILQIFSPLTALLVAWASQTLIQLVLLPVIMVGQNVLNRKSEIQADEQYRTTMSTYHDIEQIMQHLIAQDNEILRQSKMLMHLIEKSGITLQQLEVEVGHVSRLEAYTEKLSTDTPATPATNEGEK